MPSGSPLQTPADGLLRRLVDADGLLAARYRPIDVLGQGGMGIVFSALDERIGREVAIKSLRPDLVGDAELVARFAAETSTLARVHHPNVVQILDVSGSGDAVAFYVMELVPGTALSGLLRERGRLPWAQAYDVLTQVASALATVHRAGIVHRDLKPSNLLCTELGRESWHVKLIDFGIAITSGAPRLTRPGEMLGTLPYMAPEQFAAGVIDRRTDVYGWGVLALELLGGVPPVKIFGDESLAGAPLRESAGKVLEQACVQPQIVAIVQRCLASVPDDRFSDMDAVFGELGDHDDARAPTLMFQRVVVPPPVPTPVGVGPASDPDAPTRATQGGAALADDDAATRIHAGSSVPASAGAAVSAGAAASSSAQLRAPAPARARAPGAGATVFSVVVFVVALLAAFAWVAHARGWWPFVR